MNFIHDNEKISTTALMGFGVIGILLIVFAIKFGIAILLMYGLCFCFDIVFTWKIVLGTFILMLLMNFNRPALKVDIETSSKDK